jgi:hypothetical protein
MNAVTLAIEARKHISPEAIFVTDDLHSYQPVGRDFVSHETINHSSKLYVRSREDGLKVHTQTVDCFFSLVKRAHFGVYHSWSKQHLGRYIHEIAFRWRHRKTDDQQRREAALRQIGGKRLKYKMPG